MDVGREFRVCTRGEAFNVEARCLWAGPDLIVIVTGGPAPHVGAVAAASPRPSLADPEATSSDASVLCFTGHKEDQVARDIAKTLASRLGVRVVVCAGMHWEGIDPDNLSQVLSNVASLPRLIFEELEKDT